MHCVQEIDVKWGGSANTKSRVDLVDLHGEDDRRGRDDTESHTSDDPKGVGGLHERLLVLAIPRRKQHIHNHARSKTS